MLVSVWLTMSDSWLTPVVSPAQYMMYNPFGVSMFGDIDDLKHPENYPKKPSHYFRNKIPGGYITCFPPGRFVTYGIVVLVRDRQQWLLDSQYDS